jgi:hypothetical protein
MKFFGISSRNSKATDSKREGELYNRDKLGEDCIDVIPPLCNVHNFKCPKAEA